MSRIRPSVVLCPLRLMLVRVEDLEVRETSVPNCLETTLRIPSDPDEGVLRLVRREDSECLTEWH